MVFHDITSSPHPQANSKAEKGVHIVKQFLKKATDSKSDPYLALVSYRSAPFDCGLSLAELLMNCKLCTTLSHYTEIKQKTEVQLRMEKLKRKQKQRFDKATRALKPLARDEVVRIQDQEQMEQESYSSSRSRTKV